jgi:hypothetical protein
MSTKKLAAIFVVAVLLAALANSWRNSIERGRDRQPSPTQSATP